MYFQDLTPYAYLHREPDANILAVGWLDKEHVFVRGTTPEDILERILALCYNPVNKTRGFHPSPFLTPAQLGYPVEWYNPLPYLLESRLP